MLLPLRSLLALASVAFCAYPPDSVRSACAFDVRNLVLLVGTFFSPRVADGTHRSLFWYTGYLSLLHERACHNPGSDFWLCLSIVHNAAHSLALLTLFGAPWSQIGAWDVVWSTAAGVGYVVAFATPHARLRRWAALSHAVCFVRAARTVPIWFHR